MSGETLYHFQSDMKVVLEQGRDNTSALGASRGGALVAPTGGVYTLTDRAGDTVSSGPVVVVDDVATYTIPSADLPDTLTLGPVYREVWALDMPDGTTRQVRRPAAVGLYQLHPPVSQADLVGGEYPDLVTSLGTNGPSTLQAVMDSAWTYCLRYLERQGTWADVVADPGDVFDWYRHEVLRRCFGAMLQRQDSERWRDLWEYHRDTEAAARAGLRLSVDRDRDGRADSLAKEPVVKTVAPNVPARRSPIRDPRFG